MSILGQLVSGTGPDGLTYAAAVQQLGVTDASLLDDVTAAIAAGDVARLFVRIGDVVDSGHDPRRFVTDLLERFRDLLVLHVLGVDKASQLVDLPDDRLPELAEMAQGFGRAELNRVADALSDALSELRGATAPRLHLELLMSEVCLPSGATDSLDMLARLDRLERRLETVAGRAAAVPTQAAARPEAPTETPPAAAPKPASKPVAKPAAKPPISGGRRPPGPPPSPSLNTPATPAPAAAPAEAPASVSDVPLDKVLALWPRVLDRVQSNSRVAHLLVRDCRPVSLSNSILTLSQTNSGAVAAFAQGGHAERVRQAILDELKLDLTVEMTLGDQPPVARPEVSEPVVDDAEDTPSDDDESVEATAETGLELLQRELGGRKIAEFDAE
jgi:DNA polymerase-3 subunit gamma/tau